jgi:hypothetical protein
VPSEPACSQAFKTLTAVVAVNSQVFFVIRGEEMFSDHPTIKPMMIITINPAARHIFKK